MTKILKNVPQVIYQEGCYSEIAEILDRNKTKFGHKKSAFIIDDVFRGEVPLSVPENSAHHRNYWISSSIEPHVDQVDQLTEEIESFEPDFLLAIGGGAAMDICKAVSIMLKNPGSSADYQGWDLVKNKALYKIAVPTISGTGAEVSRTCVLTSPLKKQGINDDQSRFDMLILDPLLTKTVPDDQFFYTAMDCYIHGVEAYCGSFINGFSRGFADQSIDICEGIFLKGKPREDLMAASYYGGCSIVYSEVGVCHALSYGLSFVFGYHHGVANTIVFNHLEEFYPKHVPIFKEMLRVNEVKIPKNIFSELKNSDLEKMIELTYLMEKPLSNALGKDYKSKLPPSRIKEIYSRM